MGGRNTNKQTKKEQKEDEDLGAYVVYTPRSKCLGILFFIAERPWTGFATTFRVAFPPKQKEYHFTLTRIIRIKRDKS